MADTFERSALKTVDEYNGLYGKDFIYTWDKSRDELISVLSLAETLEELYRNKRSLRIFESGLAISFFRDNSTRTRIAFSSACNLLGLFNQEIEEKKTQINHGETIRETASMISFLTEVIGIRDDKYLGVGSEFIREMCESLEEGHKTGILSQRPMVVNLQDDMDHPTQVMADLLHLKKEFGSLSALKGKKMAISWAYSPSYGKPMSVPQGLLALMSRFGMDIVLAHPEGYELEQEIMDRAREYAGESGGSLCVTGDMSSAFESADIVYPKSWAPNWITRKKTEFYRNNDMKSVELLDQETLEQNKLHKDWVCDEKIMSATRGGKALYLHCLPADIGGVSCVDGEVTKGVFERYRLDTYREASHKPFIIASMIAHSRLKSPANTLRNIMAERIKGRSA